MYEGPRKVSYQVHVDDWRITEMFNYEPASIMAELKSIADELYDVRLQAKVATRELADLEEQLERREMHVLMAIQDGGEEALRDRLFKGGTKDERAAQQRYYLDSLEEIQVMQAEIGAARVALDEAQVRQDYLADKQSNYRAWGRMFEVQCKLLATVYVPKPGEVEALPDQRFVEALTEQLQQMLEEDVAALDESAEDIMDANEVSAQEAVLDSEARAEQAAAVVGVDAEVAAAVARHTEPPIFAEEEERKVAL